MPLELGNMDFQQVTSSQLGGHLPLSDTPGHRKFTGGSRLRQASMTRLNIPPTTTTETVLALLTASSPSLADPHRSEDHTTRRTQPQREQAPTSREYGRALHVLRSSGPERVPTAALPWRERYPRIPVGGLCAIGGTGLSMSRSRPRASDALRPRNGPGHSRALVTSPRAPVTHITCSTRHAPKSFI